MRTIIVFLALFATCHCWENEQLEVFDVVEEVKENFYQMLNLSNVSLHFNNKKSKY